MATASMAKKAGGKRYQIFAIRTRKGVPRLIARNVAGQKVAIEKAKAHHEKTGHMTGVYLLHRVKLFKPTAPKKK